MSKLLELQFTIICLVGLGVILKRKRLIGDAGRKNITDLVINIVLPCNIVMSFVNGQGRYDLRSCAVVLMISIAVQLFCVAYGKLAYRTEEESERQCLRYGIICSNAGFLGNPIAEGMYEANGLMLASIYLIPLRVMMWSEGIRMFSRTESGRSWKRVALHPCVLACGIGFVLMILPIHLPGVITMPLRTIGQCNTTLSMLIIGMILAEIRVRDLADRRVIRFALERLVLIPAVVYIGCRLLRIDSMVTGLCVILAAMPAGATTSMLAAKYDSNPAFATKLVVTSTLLSIPSILLWSMALS